MANTYRGIGKSSHIRKHSTVTPISTPEPVIEQKKRKNYLFPILAVGAILLIVGTYLYFR